MDTLVVYDLELIYAAMLFYLVLKQQEKSMFQYHNAFTFQPLFICRLIETETKSPTANSNIHHLNVQPPSDPIIASVLHSRHNPRPGRLILENVNNRPQTMDRGTQANSDTSASTDVPSTSNDPTNNELVSTFIFINARVN